MIAADTDVTELDLPDVRSLAGDCPAVACLLAVAEYFGVEVHGGGAFEQLLERCSDGGTADPASLVTAARDLGLDAAHNPMDADALTTAIEDGRPVVADLGRDSDTAGQYVVVFGLATAGLLVMDPARGHDVLPLSAWPGEGVVIDLPGAARQTQEYVRTIHPHEALATHYSRTWNVLHDNGERVPHWELAGAHDNLAGTDWHVDLGHDGIWRPMHADDMTRVYLWPAVEKGHAIGVSKAKRKPPDLQPGLFGNWVDVGKPPAARHPESSESFEALHPRRPEGNRGGRGGRFAPRGAGKEQLGQGMLFGGGEGASGAGEHREEAAAGTGGAGDFFQSAPTGGHKQGSLFEQGVAAPEPAAPAPAQEGTAVQAPHGQHHAPKGGVTLAGHFFHPGEFIPNIDIAEATPTEKQNLLDKQAESVNNAAQQAHAQSATPTIPAEGQAHAEAASRAHRTRRRKLTQAREQAHGEQRTIDELLGAEGGRGDQGGVHAGQRLGASSAEEPRGDQAGTGGGAGGEGRPGELPDNAGGERARSGGEPHPAEQHESVPGPAGDGAAAERPAADEGGRGRGETGTGELESGREGGDLIPQTPAESVLSQPPTPETPTDLSAGNFRYDTRDFFAGSPKAKVRNNLEAIKTLRAIQAEGRTTATPEEQQILSRYVGWGAFAQDVFASHKSGWERERQELKDLLSADDYEAARRSTVNAHYTHPDVVDAHWAMAERLGFKGGRFLETSAGIGYYLGMMPPDTAAKTKSTAVEIDPTTGAILKLLYPGARCLNQGYQDFDAPNGFYDLVASNVPFDITLYDPKTKRRYRSHDFFFLRSLDHVKPGGLVMHITSRYTMDKGEDNKHSILPELAERAEFIGAVRFPGGRHKENAGTEVVTDLLILRKKDPNVPEADPNVTPTEAEPKKPGFTGTTVDSLGRLYHWVDGKRVPGPDWTSTTLVPDPDGGKPMEVNKYFADHPEQILGRLDRTGKMREPFGINVSPTDDYAERLQAAIDRLPANVLRYDKPPTERFEPNTLPAPGEVRNGGLFVRDGKVYLKDGAEAVEQKVKPKDVPRVEGMLKIRDAMRAIIKAERVGEDSDELRASLNRVYDAYVKKFGFLNERANYLAFRADVGDSPALLALEHWSEATKTATKADMFSKSTIRPDVSIEKAGSVEEALGITLNQKGGLDLDHMAKLLDMDRAALADSLVSKGLAYHNPEGGWQQADDYLSGNVRRKLILARSAAATDPSYQPNVDALEKVQPADKEVRRIGVKLGAPWIPASDVAQFAADLLGESPEDFAIRYVPEMGKWIVKYSDRGGRLKNSSATNRIWGTGRGNTNFIDLLEAAMLNRTVRVYDRVQGDKGMVDVLNRDETDKATEKIDEIKERFEGWIWKDDERRTRLHRYYNDNINNMRDIQYDGSHLTFPGMNPEWKMRDVQKNFIWQTIRTGKGFTAHEVGIGKTAQLIASGMELKRMGLVKKPMLAVKKANIDEHTAFARWLYPGARILSLADATDAPTRKKMVSQIATGDWDLVIMSHTNMDMIEMTPQTQTQYLRDELSDLRRAKKSAVLQAAKEGGAENVRRDPTVKELEKAEASLEAKLKEAMGATKKDDAMYFEDLGVDHILVDEAHAYKSLPPYTRMAQIKGVPNSRSSRATNMLMRTRWLMDNNGGRGVVFASGTPVGNTMAELYTFQRYLQPKELEERGLHHFDAWAQTFGNVVTKNEWTHTGKYEPVARFAKFVNLTELAGLVRQFMDVQRVDDLFDEHHFNSEGEARAHVAGLFTPPSGVTPDVTPEMMAAANVKLTPREGGGFTVTQPAIVRPKRNIEPMLAPKTEQLAAYMASQIKRAEELKGKRVEKGEDNMLVLCTDNKKASVDMRLVDPGAEDDPASKTNLCVKKVLEIAKARPGVTQLIFSTLRQSKANPNFNLYDDIIDKLVAGGIPRDKIADFSQLEGDKRQEVQAAMQNGDVLVGIGGTDTLGTGVNVQKKLAALHNLDVPDRPIDIEQRDGRGFRYGNMNDPTKPASQQQLEMYRYLGEGSADDVFWGRILTKAGFINQVMRSKGKEVPDEIDDVDTESMSPERFIALIKGDPRVTEMMDLTDEVKKLRRSKERHEDEQYNFRDQVKRMESNTPHLERRLQGMRDDLKTLEGNPDFSLTVGGKTYTDRKEAGEALDQAVKETKENQGWASKEEKIGTYRGIPLVMRGRNVFIAGQGDSYATGDTLPSVEAVARRQANRIGDMEETLAAHRKDIEKTRAEIGREWGKHEDLEKKAARLKQLEDELGGKDKDKEAAPAEGGVSPVVRLGTLVSHLSHETTAEEIDKTIDALEPYSKYDLLNAAKANKMHVGGKDLGSMSKEQLLDEIRRVAHGRAQALGGGGDGASSPAKDETPAPETKITDTGWAAPTAPPAPAPAPPPAPPSRTFSGTRDAADELQSIRNELSRPAAADVDRDELLRRVDAVGQWAGSQRVNTPGLQKVLEEANSLADRVQGGSGKGGVRIQMAPPTPPPAAPPAATFGVGQQVTYTGGKPFPGKQATFRGYATDPSTGERLARVVFTHSNGAPLDTVVPASDLAIAEPYAEASRRAADLSAPAASAANPKVAELADELHKIYQDYGGEGINVAFHRMIRQHNLSESEQRQLNDAYRERRDTPASASPPPPPAAARPTEPAPPPIPVKRMKTSRGERSVATIKNPPESFWAARKAGKIPANVTLWKNKHSGRWEASVWGADDKEVRETLAELRRLGVEL